MKLIGYKKRVDANKDRDRYGQFRDGKQISSDTINGRRIWHEFKSASRTA